MAAPPKEIPACPPFLRSSGRIDASTRVCSVVPTPDGHVIDAEVAFCHDFFQVPEAEPKTEIPADTQNDDFGFKMSRPMNKAGRFRDMS